MMNVVHLHRQEAAHKHTGDYWGHSRHSELLPEPWHLKQQQQ